MQIAKERVAVTGAESLLGRRVLRDLRAAECRRIVALPPHGGGILDFFPGVVLHLAPVDPGRAHDASLAVGVRLVDEALHAGARRVVIALPERSDPARARPLLVPSPGDAAVPALPSASAEHVDRAVLQHAVATCHGTGTDVTGLLLPELFGPGAAATGSGGGFVRECIALVLDALERGTELVVPASPDRRLRLVYVDDAVRALFELAGREDGTAVVRLADAVDVTAAELVADVAGETGYAGTIRFAPGRDAAAVGDDPGPGGTWSTIRLSRSTTFTEALRRTIAWVAAGRRVHGEVVGRWVLHRFRRDATAIALERDGGVAGGPGVVGWTLGIDVDDDRPILQLEAQDGTPVVRLEPRAASWSGTSLGTDPVAAELVRIPPAPAVRAKRRGSARHLIVFPYRSVEVPALLRTAELMRLLARPDDPPMRFLLAARFDARPVAALARALSPLGPVDLMRCPTRADGHPAGPNAMFCDVARHMASTYEDDGGFWLWLEPDAVPVRTGWWRDLIAAWQRAKSALVVGKRPVLYSPIEHLNGVACYAKSLAAHVPWDAITWETAFDVLLYPFVRERAVDVDLFDVHITPENTMITPPAPGAAIHHGAKDDSVYRWVRFREAAAVRRGRATQPRLTASRRA